MSFTTYATAIAGSILTAAFWNQQVRDNGNLIKTSIADDGTLASTGGVLTKPELKNYVETVSAPAIAVTTKTISSNTLANPTVVTTSTAHGRATGDTATITGSNSTPSINGTYTITVTGASTFTIPVNVTVAGTAGTVSYGVLTLDLSAGCEFDVALNAAINAIAIQNVPSTTKVTTLTVRFTADGTLRTITWPTAFKWSGGTAPTMTSTNTKLDIITARTYDGGTTWLPAMYTQNA